MATTRKIRKVLKSMTIEGAGVHLKREYLGVSGVHGRCNPGIDTSTL